VRFISPRSKDVRKVVQIAVSSENEEIPWNLFGLCDDGTIWRKQQVKSSVRDEGPWDCVGDIPQDEDIYEPPGDIEPFPPQTDDAYPTWLCLVYAPVFPAMI
jgi:hypothetical protein